jgi:hypothetical protein
MLKLVGASYMFRPRFEAISLELTVVGTLPTFIGDSSFRHALLVTGSIPLENCILSGKR